jgi:hypothetical protein
LSTGSTAGLCAILCAVNAVEAGGGSSRFQFRELTSRDEMRQGLRLVWHQITLPTPEAETSKAIESHLSTVIRRRAEMLDGEPKSVWLALFEREKMVAVMIYDLKTFGSYNIREEKKPDVRSFWIAYHAVADGESYPNLIRNLMLKGEAIALKNGCNQMRIDDYRHVLDPAAFFTLGWTEDSGHFTRLLK